MREGGRGLPRDEMLAVSGAPVAHTHTHSLHLNRSKNSVSVSHTLALIPAVTDSLRTGCFTLPVAL